jgi:transglutaminase-like putative cysteine protease
MHFSVSHSTRYAYSQDVWLGPHVLRLRPRIGAHVHVLGFSIQIHPEPIGLEETIDAEGNLVHLAWFDRPTSSLAVATTFEARAACKNPYRFIVTEPDALRLPAAYAAQADVLEPCRRVACPDGPVAELSHALRSMANNDVHAFLNAALAHFGDYESSVRDRGAPQPPDQTLAEKAGACRDFAVLFMELCRHQGLAARFVSGYWRGLRPDDARFLHAWAEVYLPGAGWRGMDPSAGLAVADAHVPLAAAADPRNASPVAGAFHGPPDVQCSMDWSIAIHVKPY